MTESRAFQIAIAHSSQGQLLASSCSLHGAAHKNIRKISMIWCATVINVTIIDKAVTEQRNVQLHDVCRDEAKETYFLEFDVPDKKVIEKKDRQCDIKSHIPDSYLSSGHSACFSYFK